MSAFAGSTALVLLAFLGCGGRDTSAPSGTLMPAASVTGTWSVTAPDSCVARPLHFVIAGTDDEVQPYGSLTFETTWSTPTATGPAFGTVNLRNGAMAVHFQSADGAAVASLDGTLDNTTKLIGSLTDPYAGAARLLGAAGCAATVTAIRVAS